MMREEYDFHYGKSILTLSQELVDNAQKTQTNLLALIATIINELNDLDSYETKRITLTVATTISVKKENL